MKTKYFHTTCVNSTYELITDMTDQAKEISWRTFAKHIGGIQEFRNHSQQLGYDNFLKMENDYHVSFFKSYYNGKPCVYHTWSRIEHVFI